MAPACARVPDFAQLITYAHGSHVGFARSQGATCTWALMIPYTTQPLSVILASTVPPLDMPFLLRVSLVRQCLAPRASTSSVWCGGHLLQQPRLLISAPCSLQPPRAYCYHQARTSAMHASFTCDFNPYPTQFMKRDVSTACMPWPQGAAALTYTSPMHAICRALH